jgi:hypothetical protein
MSGEPTEIVDGALGDHKTHPTHIKGSQPQVRIGTVRS